MRLSQKRLRLTDLESADLSTLRAVFPHVLLIFAAVEILGDARFFSRLRKEFPHVELIGCSTAGEISSEGVDDHTAVLTAIHFDRPAFRIVATDLADMADSIDAGRRLGRQLAAKNLGHVLLFAQGVGVNGSQLIEGLAAEAGQPRISGGLAGDGGAFQRTLILSTAGVSDKQIVAMGFYGDGVEFGYGSFGGWQPFGPLRKVTRAESNVLFELDGEPALDIYKRYLGEYAAGLPASGLLFPFLMLSSNQETAGLIRTILGVDETRGALILAGDIFENGYLQLMHASTEALVDGAIAAAEAAQQAVKSKEDVLTLLISCVGRKLVMGARVDEEVEAVGEVFGSHGVLAGFYSYGEISPWLKTPECKLHNQTMTVATLREVE